MFKKLFVKYFTFFFWCLVLGIWCVFFIYSMSQFCLATFQVLSSTWLVTALSYTTLSFKVVTVDCPGTQEESSKCQPQYHYSYH